MSKSLKRVTRALEAAGLQITAVEIGSARTAREAADSAGCHVDQIAKSILFQGESTGKLYLFITAGGQQVDPMRAAMVAGEALSKADASTIRTVTGFAIGGVAPIGHLTLPTAFWDATLSAYDTVYAAAGTPRHVFAIAPAELKTLSNAQTADFINTSNIM